MAADPVRDEAERLVAAAIAAVSLAARGLAGGGSSSPRFATGSPECCVCPVCRVIATMRDPDADLADRLTTGAGDLAVAVAGMLRGMSRAAGRAAREDSDDAGREQHDRRHEPEDPWHAATRTAPPAGEPKPMAKKAVKRPPSTVPDATVPPSTAPDATVPGATKPMAKKAVAKKAVKKTPPTGESA